MNKYQKRYGLLNELIEELIENSSSYDKQFKFFVMMNLIRI